MHLREWDEALVLDEWRELLRWCWSHVLVGVESAKCNHFSQTLDREHRHWRLLNWQEVLVVLGVLVVSGGFLLLVVLELLWHWRKSHALWKVGQWVDEISLLRVRVVE